MKKSVLAAILAAVFIVVASPGIIGKLAENSIDENLNRAALASGELVVTSEGFDRGWFSSNGQHRVALGNGRIRAAISAVAGAGHVDPFPVLLINTHIDHGLIPISSLGRDEGSLAPGLGRAVSTLAVDFGGGETRALPGSLYSELGLDGQLDAKYILQAGELSVADGRISWQPTTIEISSRARTGNIEFDGNIGAMSFGNDQQTVSIDGVALVGHKIPTSFGFNVGDVAMTLGPMTVIAGGAPAGGMRGMRVAASSSVADELVAIALHLEMDQQTVPDFGDISLITDVSFSNLDATALGAVGKRLDNLAGVADPSGIWIAAEDEFKDLLAAGLDVRVDQLDVTLPMGTVEMQTTLAVPESDRATFEWTSLLLAAVVSADISVPEKLMQLATSMTPQADALIGLGYLKKEGDAYVMAARYKQGVLTINGAPIPVPLGALR